MPDAPNLRRPYASRGPAELPRGQSAAFDAAKAAQDQFVKSVAKALA
jgi:hypothetical protein